MVATIGLQDELERHLRLWFPGCATELHTVPMSDKVGGFVIWSGFEGQAQRQRQSLLWENLRQLPLPEQLGISAIFTVTQDELDSMRENE
jgi:hypothetical protein